MAGFLAVLGIFTLNIYMGSRGCHGVSDLFFAFLEAGVRIALNAY